MNEPAFVAETLEWCNARRAEQDKPPMKRLPHGERGKGRSCPCGAATGLFVGRVKYYSASPHTWTESGATMSRLLANPGIRLPLAVAEFVKAFDAGLLPQYDASLST